MNMSTEVMREALRNAPKYHRAPKWIARVNAMHSRQVWAVYMRMFWAGELTTETIQVFAQHPNKQN